MQWVRNSHMFRRILDYRRTVSSDRSPKKTRTENDGTRPAITPATPPLTASPPVDDMTNQRTALRHAVMWFLESIAKKKPENDGEILAIWTAISTVSLDWGKAVLALMLSLVYEGEWSIRHFSHEALLHESRFVRTIAA